MIKRNKFKYKIFLLKDLILFYKLKELDIKN